MPRRYDLKSICLIGSGPIVIGQAAEFDYAGCQALKVLREDGFRTIVVNSNPATIMTDPGFADRTYLEPLDLDGVAGVLRRERPDALLPTMGGGTALNLARELEESGILAELGIELIGADIDAIQRAEDRELFKQTVEGCGLKVPTSRIVTSPDDLLGVSLPAVVRPAFTLGGHGGGFADDVEQLRAQVERGIAESPIGQVLVEESVRGWDEFELEVVRDRADNVVIVCSIENLDPMGVHTGDSVTVAPQMTLSDEAYQELRDAAIAVDPRGRRRHRRVEHPVRARPRERRHPRDRDEPARLALLGARVEGDRLPDREGRGEARRRLHARRDPERPDRHDARELRADARLRRRQDPALRVREVPGRRPHARHADEGGRRDDGHRPHVHRGVREGEARARRRLRLGARGHAPVVRARARAARGGGGTPAGRAARVPPHRLRAPARSRRRRTTTTRPGASATKARPPATGAARRHSRLGPEPDRAGRRVRLLLRARRADLSRARLRGRDDQLQPGDGLDRLRHVRPALLRAARRRRRCSPCSSASSPRAS